MTRSTTMDPNFFSFTYLVTCFCNCCWCAACNDSEPDVCAVCNCSTFDQGRGQINQTEKSSVSNDPICHCVDTSNQKYKNYRLVYNQHPKQHNEYNTPVQTSPASVFSCGPKRRRWRQCRRGVSAAPLRRIPATTTALACLRRERGRTKMEERVNI